MASLTHLIEENLRSIFNQRNAQKRTLAIHKLWDRDGIFWSSEGTYAGFKGIDRAATDLFRRYPEYIFSTWGPVDEIPGAARTNWSFGYPGSAPALTGLDVIRSTDGRITALYRFLDGAGL